MLGAMTVWGTIIIKLMGDCLDMSDRSVTRRGWLVTGGLGLASVAGCLRLQDVEEDPDEDDSTDDLPTPPEPTGGNTDTPESDDDEDTFSLHAAWSFEPQFSRNILAEDDFYVRGMQEQPFARIRPDGDVIFDRSFPDDVSINLAVHNYRSPLHVSDRYLYLGTTVDDEYARVYALDPASGETAWSQDEPADGQHDLIASIDSTYAYVVYVSQSSGMGDEQAPIVRVLTHTGDQVWEQQIEEEFVARVHMLDQIVVIQELFHTYTYDIEADRRIADERIPMGFSDSTRDGTTLYTGGDTVRAVSIPELEIEWEAELGQETTTDLIVTDFGGLFVGDDAGFIYGIDYETGEIAWETRLDGIPNSLQLDQGEILWANTERGTLRALDPAANTLFHDEFEPGFTFAVSEGHLIMADTETAYRYG